MTASAAVRVPAAREGGSRVGIAGFTAVVVAWSAMVAGLTQGAITAVNAHIRDRIVYASRDVYWMAPASYLAVFAAIGVVLFVGSVIAPRVVRGRTVLIASLWAVLFSMTLPYGQVARWASAALTLGLAAALGRWLAADVDRWRRRATWQAAVMLAVVVTLGAGTRLARARATRRALGALPQAAPDVPNVLLIILDTVRSSSMHLYGFERNNTPVLDSLASSSAVFDQAIATAPWTLPSHASMFTGFYPSVLNANYVTPLDATHQTLAELLASKGYETAGFVANHHYTGYDTGLSRGFARYEDYKLSFQQVLRTSWPMQALFFYRPKAFGANVTIAQSDVDKVLQVPPKTWADAKPASEVVDEFLAWESTRAPRPYFAFLNLYDAHDPRYAPPDVRKHFVSRYPNRDWYDAAIAYMDREIGRALNALNTKGALDRTVVIVASDHGELFGNHGLWGHANSLYRDVLRVPLLVRYPPRVPGGARVTRPVSLRDLTATMTDLANIPPDEWLPGASLVPLLKAGDSTTTSPAVSYAHQTINLPRKFPAARGNMVSVIDDSLHYIRNLGDGGEELFNWMSDDREATNQIAAPERARPLGRLRALTRDHEPRGVSP